MPTKSRCWTPRKAKPQHDPKASLRQKQGKAPPCEGWGFLCICFLRRKEAGSLSRLARAISRSWRLDFHLGLSGDQLFSFFLELDAQQGPVAGGCRPSGTMVVRGFSWWDGGFPRAEGFPRTEGFPSRCALQGAQKTLHPVRDGALPSSEVSPTGQCRRQSASGFSGGWSHSFCIRVRGTRPADGCRSRRRWL